MNWKTKVAAFKMLSAIPAGAKVYRFAQERFTRSLVPTRNRVEHKLKVGLRYLEVLEQEGKTEEFLNGVHLDFGSGWQPTIPLLFYTMGVPRQYLFDLVPVMDAQIVNGTVETFRAVGADPMWADSLRLRRELPAMGELSLYEYFQMLGISYRAPYAEIFPSLSNQVDVVTSTQVLLHIAREPMLWCFEQIHRCLKPGGLFLATVYLKDLFADTDKRISKYNHLRYSAESWNQWVNSSLMSFNRFKARDYRELLQQAGFKIQRFDIEQGTPEDLKELKDVSIAPCFQRYTREELAAKDLLFIGRKD